MYLKPPIVYTYFVVFPNVCIYWWNGTYLQKILTDIIIHYEIKYETLNILFIDEFQYHYEGNSEENYLKVPSSMTFGGSYERERNKCCVHY